MPAATSAACAIAVTDPLPLVPATWSETNVRSGWPSAVHRREMLSSPSLIPNVSSAKRRSSTSAWRVGIYGGGDRHRRLDDGSGLRAHELEHAGEDVLHLTAVDDQIDHAVVDEKLAALEPFGQLLPDRLLDDARSGEADERLRFGD